VNSGQSDWIGTLEAINHIAGDGDGIDALRKIVRLLKNGQLIARATRYVSGFGNSIAQSVYRDEFDNPFADRQLSEFANSPAPYSSSRNDNVTIPQSFWNDDLSKYWTEDMLIGWGDWIDGDDCQILSNWAAGDFEKVSVAQMYEYKGEMLCSVQVERISRVELERKFIEHLAGRSMSRTNSAAQPNWRYDWLKAFAYVAAICRDDPPLDIHKHGAQAEIGRWLEDWFSTNSTQIPSPKAIKDKSRIILTALKAKDSQA
jgi:hypothetical protein